MRLNNLETFIWKATWTIAKFRKVTCDQATIKVTYRDRVIFRSEIHNILQN